MSTPTLPPPARIELLGVRVDLLTPAAALARMHLFAADGGMHHVVTVNPEFIMAAQSNAEFREVIRRADLSLPDGVGVLWAGRLHGQRLTERVTGSDTVRALADFAARHHLRPFLLGAAPGVAEQAAIVLQREFPGLEIAGVFAGSPAPGEADDIIARIQAARPDLLFVAYGAPQQDLWIARYSHRLQVPLSMGVGGTFDFIAGVRKRAPVWMQRAGIEWMYRLLQEPRRWRRMLALPRFAGAVVLERLARR